MGNILRLILLFTLLCSLLHSNELELKIEIKLAQERPIIKSLYSLNSKQPLWIGHAKNFHSLTQALENPYYNYKDKNFYRIL